ncbi:hypothetical protein, partial [Vogesella fluminis]
CVLDDPNYLIRLVKSDRLLGGHIMAAHTTTSSPLLFCGTLDEALCLAIPRVNKFDRQYVMLTECQDGFLRLGYSSNPRIYLHKISRDIQIADARLLRVAICQPAVNGREIAKALIATADDVALYPPSAWEDLVAAIERADYQWEWTAEQLAATEKGTRRARALFDATLALARPVIDSTDGEARLLAAFRSMLPYQQEALICMAEDGNLKHYEDEVFEQTFDGYMDALAAWSECQILEVKAMLYEDVCQLADMLGQPHPEDCSMPAAILAEKGV